MSLLRLTPEVRRLRRVAKACAAGEVTRFDYRQARREVIDAFTDNFGYGEDTMRRDEVTLRRYEFAAEAIPERQASRRWAPVVIAALLALVVAQVALAGEIPIVKERDPNPVTSPRLSVASVDWQIPEDLPGIATADVHAFLAARLDEVRASNAPLEHGFSNGELTQVGRFLNAIGVHETGTKFTAQDLEDLAALVNKQKEQRGVSIVQLEGIARSLQEFVRDQGYPLARAYLPPQQVAEGRVQLAVLPGRLESVQVSGANANVSGRFEGILGQPVERAELETRLNGLNRLPGVRAQASFVPGEEVGASEMVLDIADEQRFRGVLQLDNYGLDDGGTERLLVLGQVNNPRGLGDQLEVRVASGLGDSDANHGGISYLTPLMGGKLDGRVRLRTAALDWHTVGIQGDGWLFDGALRHTDIFTRKVRREFEFLTGLHDLEWEGLDDQRSWYVGGAVSGHRIWDDPKVAIEGEAAVLSGRIDTVRIGQEDSFWLARTTARGWTPWLVPWVELPAKAVLELRAQASSSYLPTSQQLGLSGVAANRGFAQTGVLVDQGAALKGELLFKAPVGELGMFVDAGYGERNNPDGDWFQLSSLGVSWNARLYEHVRGALSMRLSVAKPVSHKGARSTEFGEIDEDAHVYWSLQYSH